MFRSWHLKLLTCSIFSMMFVFYFMAPHAINFDFSSFILRFRVPKSKSIKVPCQFSLILPKEHHIIYQGTLVCFVAAMFQGIIGNIIWTLQRFYGSFELTGGEDDIGNKSTLAEGNDLLARVKNRCGWKRLQNEMIW